MALRSGSLIRLAYLAQGRGGFRGGSTLLRSAPLRHFSATVPGASGVVSTPPSSDAVNAIVDTTTTSASADAINSVATLASSVPSNGRYPDFEILTSTLETVSPGLTDWSIWFMKLMNWLHVDCGMEWWAAVAAVSLAIRAGTLPLFLLSVKTGAKMQAHTDNLSKFGDAVSAAKNSNDTNAIRTIMTERREYMKKNGLKMRYVFLPMLVQVPIFISVFRALRTFASEAHLVPGFSTGGTAWFPALHLPDPTGIIPITGIAFAVSSIVYNNNIQGIPQAGLTPGGQKVLFGGMAGLFGLVSLAFPADLQIYVATTSLTMFLQQWILRIKGFPQMIGFPDNWPLSPEEIAARTRKRAEMGIKDNNPLINGLSGFRPIFVRASRIAEGNFSAIPTHEYLTITGLRNPGAPPPPPRGEVPTLDAAVGASTSEAVRDAVKRSTEAVAQATAAVSGADYGGKLLDSKPKRSKK